MANRRLIVEVIGNSSNFEKSMTRSTRSANQFEGAMHGVIRTSGGFSRGFLSGAGALSSFGGALALTSGSFFAGAGLVAGLKASVGAAGDFQQTLNVLRQVAGATSGQMAEAAAEAQKLGADISLPATSATDAAHAMLQLAKGGLTVKESIAAARGTLQLAAAAQTDVGTAANTTARALTAFGLSGAHAGEIADALANGANLATGDINDFAIGLSQSSQSAHQFGLTAGQTVTALTELAQAGLIGSDAGTSLRVMLGRLIPSTKKAQEEVKRLGVSVNDGKGAFLPFPKIIENYSRALNQLTPVARQHALQVLFGTDAQRAANIILGQGADKFNALNVAVTKHGGAAATAAAQQKGFKGALDGFNSALQTTEVTIGQTLLPTLTAYLHSGAKWLSQSQNQKKIQKDVAEGVHIFSSAIKGAVRAIQTVDSVTGSFKHTLELLLALKAAGWAASLAGSVGRMATGLGATVSQLGRTQKASEKLDVQFGKTAAGAQKVSQGISGIAQLQIAAVTIPIVYEITTVILDKTGGSDFLRKQGAKLADDISGNHGGQIDPTTKDLGRLRGRARSILEAGGSIKAFKDSLTNRGLEKAQIDAIVRIAQHQAAQAGDRGGTQAEAAAKAAFGKAFSAASTREASNPKDSELNLAAPHQHIKASKLNEIFDNQISRILLRGGLGDITAQIAALNQADTLISHRIAVTKDVTRKLNLEDQLLTNEAQIKSLAKQRAANLAAARIAHRNAQQFALLGLTKTGEERAPGVRRLRREVGTIEKDFKGTPLDTKAMEARFKRIRRLLAEPIIGRDVRAKLQSQLDAMRAALKKFNGDLTKFHHQSSRNFVKSFEQATGLDLTRGQSRTLQALLSERGAGGKVPGKGSAAFSLAGATVHSSVDVNLDGTKVARAVTTKQINRHKKRTLPRGV